MKKLLVLALLSHAAFASRIKDMVSIKGVRENQLIGYGLVVGLKGTGDSKQEFTGTSMVQMLRQMGLTLKSEWVDSKNVAAVVLTATMPPFGRVGARLDVLANSIGDAKSLQGGTLLMTPLKGADGNVYAVAQGALSLGGFSEGGGGSSSGKNHPTVAKIPNGAIVEREVGGDFSNRNALRLALHNPDFTTSARIAKTINTELGGLYARAKDAATVDVIVPYDFEGGVVELVSSVERLVVEADNRAKIVINERTGTLIMGDAVRVSHVAVAHGNLTLEIKAKETTTATPDPRAPAQANANPPADEDKQNKLTSTVKETTVQVGEQGDKLIRVPSGATLGDVVKALNTLGVSPRDLIAILQSMKAQGALQAELEIL